MAASTAAWQVVYLHHPPFTSGAHESHTTLQWPYAAWGADAVLAGHDHVYERIELNGIPYFVNGLGGNGAIHTFNTPVSGSQVRYNGDFGAMIVDASDQAMTFRFISVAGETVDSYTIVPDDGTSGTVDVRIGSSTDDVEETQSSGAMYFDSSDLELGNDPGFNGDQSLGLLFRSINVPQGATVTNAWLEFETDETGSGTTIVDIRAHASDNAPDFTSTTFDLTSRPTTSSSVNWNIPAWNTVDEAHQSPDLSAVVQELINRPGWVPGNNVAFVVTGTGTRTAESYDGEPAAPLLHIDYSTETGTNTPPVAVNDVATTVEDTAVNIAVLGNDSDANGDSLVVQSATQGASGQVVINPDNTVTYTPNVGFIGADSFQYTVSDGNGGSRSADVNVTVNASAASSGLNLAHGIATNVGSSGWTTVTLSHTYASMVVIATPQYELPTSPGVVRIQNAVGNSFDVRVDSAGGEAISGVNVHYIVVEEGVYETADYKLEAVKFTSTVTDYDVLWTGEVRNYQQSYTAPVVVGQVMSYNDPDWSVFWASGNSRIDPPSSTELRLGKHVGENPDVSRANETIGYLVIESSTSGTNEIEGLPYVAAVGADTIQGVDDPAPFQYTYSAMPNAKTAVAGLAGMDDADGGWVVLYGANALPADTGTLNLAVDEDQKNDNERLHSTEQVAYFIIDPPVASDPVVEQVAESFFATASASRVSNIRMDEISTFAVTRRESDTSEPRTVAESVMSNRQVKLQRSRISAIGTHREAKPADDSSSRTDRLDHYWSLSMNELRDRSRVSRGRS